MSRTCLYITAVFLSLVTTAARAFDPTTDCQQWITFKTVGGYDEIAAALADPQPFLHNDQAVLCFRPFKNPVTNQLAEIHPPAPLVINAQFPTIIHGLELLSPKPNTTPFPYLTLTSANITLDNVKLTGPGPGVAGSVGIKLEGHGHQVTNSEITGFATAIEAECALPPDDGAEIPPNPPFAKGGAGGGDETTAAACTIGPRNTFGKTGINDKQRVGIGVHVPTTGQHVTVIQNTMATVLEADPNVTNDQRIVNRLRLAPGANGGIQPPPIVYDPPDQATVWVEKSADQLTYTRIIGVLPAQGTVELFRELPHAFLQSCLVTQRWEEYAFLPVSADTWIYDCNGLQLPVMKTKWVTLVYTHAGHSAPYQVIQLDKAGSTILPNAPIPGAPSSAAPEGPAPSDDSTETDAMPDGFAALDPGSQSGNTVALTDNLPNDTAVGPAPLPPIFAPTPAPPIDVATPTPAPAPTNASPSAIDEDGRSAAAMTGTAGAAAPLAGCSLVITAR